MVFILYLRIKLWLLQILYKYSMKYTNNIYFTLSLWAILSWIVFFYFTKDIYLSYLVLLMVVLLLYLFLLHYRQYLLHTLFIIFGVFLWIYIASIDYNSIQTNSEVVDRYKGMYIEQAWTVTELYRRSEFYDEYVVHISTMGRQDVDTTILALLRIPKNFDLVPGQIISYWGKIYPLEDFDGFSYKRYMQSKNIFFSSSTNIFETHREENNYKTKLYLSRQRLLSIIDKKYPETEAIFLWGILFWARENIPQDLKEDFNNSGLTHFIAVSGFNITLCIIFISFLFSAFPPIIRMFWVIISIIAFTYFVGLWAPVVRAAIMGIIAYIVLQSWANVRNITLLLFTACVMAIFSPMILIYDVSFHLSFLAVIGIIYTQDFFKKIFYFLPNIFAIKEAFILTICALSFSLPIMIFQFGQLSLLSPIANIAVTWTIPLAMLWGAISLVLDPISQFLSTGIWFFTWTLLHYDILMVRFFGNLDFALIQFDFWAYKNYLQALYFIFLTYFVSLYHIQKKKQL